MNSIKTLAAIIALVGLMSANIVWAHSAMQSTPKDSEILTKQPKFVELEFGKEVRVLKFSIRDEQENEIEFTTDGSKKFVSTYKANFNDLPKGEYFISWSAVGKDGHPMKNKFSFNIE